VAIFLWQKNLPQNLWQKKCNKKFATEFVAKIYTNLFCHNSRLLWIFGKIAHNSKIDESFSSSKEKSHRVTMGFKYGILNFVF
jgi:hypothetical protein